MWNTDPQTVVLCVTHLFQTVWLTDHDWLSRRPVLTTWTKSADADYCQQIIRHCRMAITGWSHFAVNDRMVDAVIQQTVDTQEGNGGGPTQAVSVGRHSGSCLPQQYTMHI